MASDATYVPTRFQLKWLLGPLALIAAAAAITFLIPSLPPDTSSLPIVEQPVLVEQVDVSAAKLEATAQCSLTFDCSQLDCLEKVLTHIDSASVSIDAVLRTPAPKVLRDHLRLAIKRGVAVQLVLDASLNPKFYLQGAVIRVKQVNKFVAANFMIIDDEIIVHGSDPQIYAAAPDVIHVACEDNEKQPYLDLFSRVWEAETNPYSSELLEEEVLSDSELTLDEGSTCNASECGPDSYTCSGTTKIFQDYFCSDVCVYQIIPLSYSPDCGYTNPGFDEEGNPLITITESEVDGGQVSSEFLEFTASQPVELTGFTLLKNNEVLVTFASPFILNGAARVYTPEGTTTTVTVYLNKFFPLWNEPGTTATLLNPNGFVVASQTFED